MSIEKHRAEAARMVETIDVGVRDEVGDDLLIPLLADMLASGTPLRVTDLGTLSALAVGRSAAGKIAAAVRVVEVTDENGETIVTDDHGLWLRAAARHAAQRAVEVDLATAE